MTGTASTADQGRDAFDRSAWVDAYAQLVTADRESSLAAADLEPLATAAYLTGRDHDSADVWERAHQEFLRLGDPVRAVRCAFWLGLGLALRGEDARAGAWLARAQRLLDDGRQDCAEQGYLLVPVALACLATGDADRAHTTFSQVHAIGVRFVDHDLMAFGRLGRGQALGLPRGRAAPAGPRSTAAAPAPPCAGGPEADEVVSLERSATGPGRTSVSTLSRT